MTAVRRPAPALLRDPERLQATLDAGQKPKEIAARLEVHVSIVYRYIRQHGLVWGKTKRNVDAFSKGKIREDIAYVMAKDAAHHRNPSSRLFKARVKAVMGAWVAGDKLVLRGALVDLAAFCERWAGDLPSGSFE